MGRGPCPEGRSWRAALTFAGGLLPAVLVTAAYDMVRFGAPWRVGYEAQHFNHPVLVGLYGLLLSPAAGLLLRTRVLVKQGKPNDALALLNRILPPRPVKKEQASALRTVIKSAGSRRGRRVFVDIVDD